MKNTRCGLLHVLVGLGVLIATPLFAQNASVQNLTAPPVFQGLMVDAKGNTVGRLFTPVPGGFFVGSFPAAAIVVPNKQNLGVAEGSHEALHEHAHGARMDFRPRAETGIEGVARV